MIVILVLYIQLYIPTIRNNRVKIEAQNYKNKKKNSPRISQRNKFFKCSHKRLEEESQERNLDNLKAQRFWAKSALWKW